MLLSLKVEIKNAAGTAAAGSSFIFTKLNDVQNRKIIVKNGSESRTYTLEVTYAGQAKPVLSNNASLQSLDIKGDYFMSEEAFTLEPVFNAEVTAYTGTTTLRAEKLIINAKAVESGATVELQGKNGGFTVLQKDTKLSLNPDKTATTEVVIRVTAPDNKTTKTYTVTVKRLLTSIKLVDFTGTAKGQPMSGFFDEFKAGNTSSKNFTASVDADTTQIILNAEAEYPDTTNIFIKVDDGEKRVFSSPHTVTLNADPMNPVTEIQLIVESQDAAQNGLGNVYRLTVTKKAGSENDPRIKNLTLSYASASGTEISLQSGLVPGFTPANEGYTLSLSAGVTEVEFFWGKNRYRRLATG